MGSLDAVHRLLSSQPPVSDDAIIWAFDGYADKKEIDEYDLIVVMSDDADLPIFIQVNEEMYIPEGALAYRSVDEDWAMKINDDKIVRTIPCMFIPPPRADELDTTQSDVIKVPEELTGGTIPPSAEREDDLSDGDLQQLM